jgi:NTE family protein
MQDRTSSRSIKSQAKDRPGQIVLVLQGGGALGSYQAGVYQALHEAGIEPDWIIGTSIGAINASLIAGNEPQARVSRLQEFWKRMEQNPAWNFGGAFPGFNEKLSYWSTITHGVAGFFRPNPLAHAGDAYVLGPERAGYYTTTPLQKTLEELVDFDLVNRCTPRLTVGAAHVRTSQMRYFDSRDGAITVKHVMQQFGSSSTSEALGTQQRIGQVDQQTDRDEAGERIVEDHDRSPFRAVRRRKCS